MDTSNVTRPNSVPFLADLNTRSEGLCQHAIRNADELNISVSQYGTTTLIDFGIERMGSFSAAQLLTKICMANLCEVSILPARVDLPLPTIQVITDWPLQSCIAAQYAGWPFSTGDYFAMCSGPARVVRGKEEILSEYNLSTHSGTVVAVFESDRLPTVSELEQFINEFPSRPSAAIVCVAPTNSMPGTMQVVARSVETAMHKLHEIDCDLTKVQRAIGTAPLPPLGKSSFQSLGWTNDSILYGAHVDLWMDVDESQAQSICENLPSRSSSDFGRPFADIFAQYDHDFYKIDRMLFSPASVSVYCLGTGRFYRGGEIRPDILRSSFRID